MTKESETLRVSGSIQHFEIIRGEKVGPDYGAYAIVIVTDRGKWRISGCHDTGPELMEVNDSADQPEFQVGQPVVEISTMHPAIIEAVNEHRGDYGGSVRYRYDLKDGSRGLNENEIDAVVGVRYTPSVIRWYKDGIERTESHTGELLLVTSDDDLVAPPSVEFYEQVKAWLKMPDLMVGPGGDSLAFGGGQKE